MNLVSDASVTAGPHTPAVTARIYIVDDDAPVRSSLVRLLRVEGYEVVAFGSAAAFLEQHDAEEHGCLVLDIAMPGLDGLALQAALIERGGHMPVIFLTGQADVPMSVCAMKRGAFDLLTKPVDAAALLDAIARALERDVVLERERLARDSASSRLATLTARERQVLAQVIAGRLNKQIAADLGTAEKTVKVHRARCMEKMRVRSVAELVRVVDKARPPMPEAC